MKKQLNTLSIIALPIAFLAGVVALVIAGGDGPGASFTTSLAGRTPEQLHNIGRAAHMLDRVTVQPGETFSFNRTVGDRTADRGFLPAGTIVEGELDDGLGGGICQVSSTLYNAALLAGLEVTERHAHSYPVRSVPPGRDATVVYAVQDLRFRNNFPDPVTIRAGISGERLVVHITGGSKSHPETRIVVDTDDSVRRISTASGGPTTHYCTATVWREELNGSKVVRRDFVSSDTYRMSGDK